MYWSVQNQVNRCCDIQSQMLVSFLTKFWIVQIISLYKTMYRIQRIHCEIIMKL